MSGASNKYQNKGSYMKDVQATRKALRKHAPDALKALDKANRAAAKPLVTKARAQVPSNEQQLSGWIHNGRTGWDSAKVKRGMTFKQKREKTMYGWRTILGLWSLTAAGSIWELAGYRTRSQFSTALSVQAGGSAPRGIWLIVNKYGISELTEQVKLNYKEAERQLQAELDRIGR